MTLGPQFDLYHGSNAAFAEGDIIQPGYHNEFGVGAYATDDPAFAGLHAAAAARRGKTTKSDEFSQPALFSTVYKVSPLSPPEEITTVEGLVGNEMVDPKGLKVEGVHSFYPTY